MTDVGQSPPDERTRKVSWDMVRRSAKPRTDERLLHVSTKCRSIDDLVNRFAPFASHDGLTVPSRERFNVGDTTRVRLTLADASEVLSARGQVVYVRPADVGASDTRSVVRVKLLEMDEASQLLFLRLCEHHRGTVPVAPQSDSEKTSIPNGREDLRPRPPGKSQPPPHPVVLGRVPTKAPAALAVGPSPSGRRPTPFAQAKPVVPPRDRSRSNVPTAQPPAPMYIPAAAIGSSSLPNEAAMRVAGSQYKLPANPLAELGPEAVRSFVDLNLYEADGDAPPRLDDDTRRADQPSAELLDAVRGQDDPEGENERRGQGAGAWKAARRWVDRLPLPLRRTLMQAIPFAFCTMLGWFVGFHMAGVAPPRVQSSAPDMEQVPGPAVAEMAKPPAERPAARPPEVFEAAAMNPPAQQPKTERVVPAGAAAAPTTHPAPVSASNGEPAATCLAEVQTRPADVVVRWGNKLLGKTPVAPVAVPCGLALVTLERDRYETLTRKVEAVAGVALQLKEKLKRPAARLTVTSTPLGAVVELNGRPVGKTPRGISVSRFESVKVNIRLSGHRPWHTNLYLKDPQNALHAKLDVLPPSAKKK